MIVYDYDRGLIIGCNDVITTSTQLNDFNGEVYVVDMLTLKHSRARYQDVAPSNNNSQTWKWYTSYISTSELITQPNIAIQAYIIIRRLLRN